MESLQAGRPWASGSWMCSFQNCEESFLLFRNCPGHGTLLCRLNGHLEVAWPCLAVNVGTGGSWVPRGPPDASLSLQTGGPEKKGLRVPLRAGGSAARAPAAAAGGHLLGEAGCSGPCPGSSPVLACSVCPRGPESSQREAQPG